MKRLSGRTITLWLAGAAAVFLVTVTVLGIFMEDAAAVTDFTSKDLAPNAAHLFGTDWMGRDMFTRTIAGLSLSIRIGLLTAVVSAGIALLLGILSAAFGG